MILTKTSLRSNPASGKRGLRSLPSRCRRNFSPHRVMTDAILYSRPEAEPEQGKAGKLKKAMIAETSLIAAKWKIFGGCLAMVVFGVADTQVTPASLEDYTLKGLLLLALVFVVRLLLKQQEDHKKEMDSLRSKHEEMLKGVIEKNTESNERVCEQAEEQTRYFREVTKGIVDEKINGGRK